MLYSQRSSESDDILHISREVTRAICCHSEGWGCDTVCSGFRVKGFGSGVCGVLGRVIGRPLKRTALSDHGIANRRFESFRNTMRAEEAQGTPNQSHISPYTMNEDTVGSRLAFYSHLAGVIWQDWPSVPPSRERPDGGLRGIRPPILRGT